MKEIIARVLECNMGDLAAWETDIDGLAQKISDAITPVGKIPIPFLEEQQADILSDLKAALTERQLNMSSLANKAFGFSLLLDKEIEVKLITMWLNRLQDICHEDAVAAGWYTDLETGEPIVLNVGERMALIHSEVSEAFEAHRKDLMDDHLPYRKGLEVELADAIIRIMDFAGDKKLDIAGALIEKLEYNRNRPDHKIENRKKANGKKC